MRGLKRHSGELSELRNAFTKTKGARALTRLVRLERKKQEKKQGNSREAAAPATATVAVLVDMDLDVGRFAHWSSPAACPGRAA